MPSLAIARPARRFARLPRVVAVGTEVPVAEGWARLLGLACLDRERAGSGLLIPRCRSVHTFGMRFALDVAFLDAQLVPIEVLRDIGPGRIVSLRAAKAVLERPAGGGEPGRGSQ